MSTEVPGSERVPEERSGSSPAPEDADHRAAASAAHEGWARWVAAAIAVVLAAAFIPGPQDFPLDDAWIHLSYAKSLRLGDGPSYNPGDHELGFSSPLWMALLAVWPIAGDPVRAVQLLGVLLHGLTAWIAAQLGLDLARRRATLARPLPVLSLGLLSGSLVAASPTLVSAATSGMEVPLTAAVGLGVTWAMLMGSPRAAGVLGALAVAARPEALGLVVALAGIVVPWRWRSARASASASTSSSPSTPSTDIASIRAPLAAVLGGLVALAIWMAYCQAVAGQWWPNAQAIKGTGGGLAGLTYLQARVLPWQPWLVSLTGVVALAIALRIDLRQRRVELLAIACAALATWIAIAISRPLDPAVLFFLDRYFIPFCPGFAIVLPFALPHLLQRGPHLGRRRWLAFALVVPVAVVSGLQISALHDRALAQRADTHQLHGALARTIADTLPRDARVAVEGAGAPRFFAPRSMTILDLVGLNDHQAAQRHFDRRAKLCHLVRLRPTHMAMPADWVPLYAPVFALRPVARFDDPQYTQVDPPRGLTVLLMSVEAIHPDWLARCDA